jgi:hypothetical protein
MDYEAVVRVLTAFERRGVKYAIFGGVALNLHGLARFTEDIDLFIAPEARNIELMKAALSDAFHDPKIEEITAEDLLGDYPAVEYAPPDGTFHMDLLTRLGDAFRFADLETERIPFDGLTVTVVTLGCSIE